MKNREAPFFGAIIVAIGMFVVVGVGTLPASPPGLNTPVQGIAAGPPEQVALNIENNIADLIITADISVASSLTPAAKNSPATVVENNALAVTRNTNIAPTANPSWSGPIHAQVVSLNMAKPMARNGKPLVQTAAYPASRNGPIAPTAGFNTAITDLVITAPPMEGGLWFATTLAGNINHGALNKI